jgi:hypothetical protein
LRTYRRRWEKKNRKNRQNGQKYELLLWHRSTPFPSFEAIDGSWREQWRHVATKATVRPPDKDEMKKYEG